jgi:ABC-type branched-subunit amino acid transport system ATPase component
MTSSVLEADRLHTHYGKSHILHGVSLEVREGEIVTSLGRNARLPTAPMSSTTAGYCSAAMQPNLPVTRSACARSPALAVGS